MASRLGEGEDASLVTAARTHIDVEVLLALGEWQTIDAGGSPWVDVAVDVYHLRGVLGQEIYRVAIEGRGEFYSLGIIGQHKAMQIALCRLDAQILLEWLGVIAIVAQLLGCLPRPVRLPSSVGRR